MPIRTISRTWIKFQKRRELSLRILMWAAMAAVSSLAVAASPNQVQDDSAIDLTARRVASSMGTLRDAQSITPAMLGDYFGGSFTSDSATGAAISLAGGDRMFKIANNVSPMPQDRVFVNYNHFHNALHDPNSNEYSLDRFTFGAEKTFVDKLMSVEVRLPFASALNSTYDFDRPVPQATELGNLAFGLKAVLVEYDKLLVSAGTTMTLPTGDDYNQKLGGQDILSVKNDAVHIAPFVGILAKPNQHWFFQGFVQTDFDTHGDRVYSDGLFEGRLQDQNLLFVDISGGRWLLRRSQSHGRFVGIAGITELHYTGTMNNTDSVFGITNANGHMDVLNATKGFQILYGKTALRVGAVVPLRRNADRLFEEAAFVQASRMF